MKAVDRKVPWGRPPEDIIARRKERTNHKLHRQRLRDSRCMVDSSKPNTTNMAHLRVRAKKRQLADDRLQTIAIENRKLMEKMSAIMRLTGPATATTGGNVQSPSKTRPLMKGEAVHNKGGLHDVMRKKEQRRIADENRTIIQKLRAGAETKSFYDHNTMARAETQRIKYIKNISKKYNRDLRASKHQARKLLLSERLPEMNMTNGSGEGGEEGGGYGYSQVMDGAMNLTLHTAKQIRMDVANQRGMPLPDIISRRPGESNSPIKMQQMQGQQQQQQQQQTTNHDAHNDPHQFILKHEGMGGEGGGGGEKAEEGGISFSPEFAGSMDGGGAGFGDYDYNSADGGDFHGRGYSRSDAERPSTTAQSQRTRTEQ
ncbi:hypothetical protein ScalyP_jg7700 [Parmales sp. scaly parma]|nr:hypothetical protein ScalyP_jg7700 [Parmales sp. scaly parma]